MKASANRLTPAAPCCDTCVISALARSEFPYNEPFVIANLEGRTREQRAALLDALLDDDTRAVVLISTPAPEQTGQIESTEDDSTGVTVDTEGLDESTLREILGFPDDDSN